MTRTPRIKLPETAKAGDVIEVKTLVTHVMETGNRKDKDGHPIPRQIINAFTVNYAGRQVFRADLNSGVSANPYISFFVRVTGPGSFEFTWIDDAGERFIEITPLNVI